jgi:hypothetical protein
MMDGSFTVTAPFSDSVDSILARRALSDLQDIFDGESDQTRNLID